MTVRLGGLTPLLLLFGLALSAPAQDTSFDPETHLSGYASALTSAHKALYGFDAFEALRGEALSQKQLTDLRSIWQKEQERVNAKIAEIAPKASPLDDYWKGLSKRLTKHPYFKTIGMHRIEGDGYTLLVQKLGKEPRNYTKSIETFYGPWLKKAGELFEREYVQLLGLKRRSDQPLVPVIVLATSGDYLNYLRTHKHQGSHTWYGCYNEDLRVVITHLDDYRKRAAFQRRFAVLSDCVLAELHAHTPEGSASSPEIWFTEGLAAYLSFHLGREPEVLEQRLPYRTALESLGSILRKQNHKQEHWLSFDQLIGLRGYHDLSRLSLARGKKASTMWMFEAQTALWMYYLHEGEQRLHRQSVWEYLKRVQRGEGGRESFLATFGIDDPVAFERHFRTYVVDLYWKEFGAVVPGEASGAEVATPEPEAPEPPFDPRTLAVVPQEESETLALALWTARAGDVTKAHELVAAALAAEPRAESRARLERAEERLAALRGVRDAYLAELGEKGGRLRLTIAGERVNLRVADVQEDRITFERNKAGVEALDARVLPVAELIGNLGKRTAELGPDWVRGYSQLLDGNARWKRALNGENALEAQLIADGAGDVPTLLAQGAAQADLNALAEGPLPADAEAADARLVATAAVLAEHGGTHFVTERQAGLRSLAEVCLEVLFERDGLAESTNGKLVAFDDGRVHLTYEFEDSSEGDDFTNAPSYLSRRRAAMNVAVPSVDESSFSVASGGFRGVGRGCHRHFLEFAAPMRVEYQLRYLLYDGQNAAGNLFAGICDDGAENYIACLDLAHLEVRDREGQRSERLWDADRTTLDIDRTYELELRHDGTKVSTWLDGTKYNETQSGTLIAGGVFLLFHSGLTVSIDRLTIEGAPTPESLARVRAEWVRAKLAELGLAE